MSNRNNEDRLSAKHANSGPPILPILENNDNNDNNDNNPNKPVFNFSTPTEFVELPSKGKYYPENHPLHNEEFIEIRYMTAKDEDILSSKALLKKGVAIDRMLANIIINNNIKVQDLLTGDKNALVVAARVTGYGDKYETKVTCPVCGNTNEHEFNLSDAKTIDGDEQGKFIIIINNNGTFTTKLVKSDYEITFRLLSGADEQKLVHLATQQKKARTGIENTNTTQLKLCIVGIDGETSPKIINDFVNSMPAIDARYLRDAMKKVTPNIDLTQEFYCHNCDFEGNMEVPFTTDFFWPK